MYNKNAHGPGHVGGQGRGNPGPGGPSRPRGPVGSAIGRPPDSVAGTFRLELRPGPPKAGFPSRVARCGPPGGREISLSPRPPKPSKSRTAVAGGRRVESAKPVKVAQVECGSDEPPLARKIPQTGGAELRPKRHSPLARSGRQVCCKYHGGRGVGGGRPGAHQYASAVGAIWLGGRGQATRGVGWGVLPARHLVRCQRHWAGT